MQKSTLILFFKDAAMLMKKDPFIICPYLIFFFSFKVVSFLFPSVFSEKLSFQLLLIQFILIGWIIEIFFKSLTMIMAQKLKKTPNIPIQDSIKETIQKYKTLILSTTPFMIPLFFIFYTSITSLNNQSFNLLTVINFILLIPLSIMIHFIPATIIVLTTSKNTPFIKLTWEFIKNNLKTTIMFVLLTYLINIFSLILGSLFSFIPIIGQAIIQVIFQSAATSLIYIATYLFYQEFTAKNKHLENKKIVPPTKREI